MFGFYDGLMYISSLSATILAILAAGSSSLSFGSLKPGAACWL